MPAKILYGLYTTGRQWAWSFRESQGRQLAELWSARNSEQNGTGIGASKNRPKQPNRNSIAAWPWRDRLAQSTVTVQKFAAARPAFPSPLDQRVHARVSFATRLMSINELCPEVWELSTHFYYKFASSPSRSLMGGLSGGGGFSMEGTERRGPPVAWRVRQDRSLPDNGLCQVRNHA